MIRHQKIIGQASKSILTSIKKCEPQATGFFGFSAFLAFGTVLHDIQAPGFVALVVMCYALFVLVPICITTLTIPPSLSSC